MLPWAFFQCRKSQPQAYAMGLKIASLDIWAQAWDWEDLPTPLAGFQGLGSSLNGNVHMTIFNLLV